MAKVPVAVQLYTLRDQTEKDFAGTVHKVAELGYTGVEFAGYGGLEPAAMRRLLDDCGLRACGTHAGIDKLKGQLEREIEYAQTVGYQYIGVPWSSKEARADRDACKRFAAWLNETGARVKAAGLTLVYHNHDFEFEQVDGQYVLDIYMQETDPSLVQMELDCYWATKAGVDPAAYIRKYADRVPLVHLKDMTPGPDPTFAEVGEGVIDYQPVFAAASVGGATWYVVEQDRCQRPSLESVTISLRNLKKWGIA